MRRAFVTTLLSVVLMSCNSSSPLDQSQVSTTIDTATSTSSSPPTQAPPLTLPLSAPPIYVVLFTHIEDNTPKGDLGTSVSLVSYMDWRDDIIAMAELARDRGFTWVLQPDWKVLVAAQSYEVAPVIESTNGKNVLQYIHEDLGVVIDPHSHEKDGYNYTDVAYLLEQLGVGGTTVIGGHIWDPSLPQFAHWDRFRNEVQGTQYPMFSWRGDILMGSGTPNHTNDPTVSGIWHPRDAQHYWEDDPDGNIIAVGAYKNDLEGIAALADLYDNGSVDKTCMLTSTFHVFPKVVTNPVELEKWQTEVLTPLLAMRDQGEVVITDFSELANTFETDFAGQGCLWQES